MKRLLIFIFLSIELFAKAQVTKPNYFTPVATAYEWNWGRFKYVFRVPTDTLPTSDSGSIAYKNGVWYGKNLYWSAIGGAVTSVGTIAVRRSITKVGDSAQLVGDTSLGAPNATPLAYQIINGVRTFSPVKADTSDIFGIDSSLYFPTVTELRANSLYAKGARFAITSGFTSRNDGGGALYTWNPSSTVADDGQFHVRPISNPYPSPGVWELQPKGVIRASEAGIKNDGTNQLTGLQSLVNSGYKSIRFDNGTVTYAGKLSVPSGVKLIFENDAKLSGDGGANDTLSGGIIVCDLMKQCLDTSITPLNIENDMWSVRWGGANGKKSLFDNWKIFDKAQYALKQFTNLSSYFRFGGKLYIPRDDSSYHFSRPWHIRTTCEIAGDGEIQTMLDFPNDSAGVILDYVDGIVIPTGGYFQYIHDLSIRGYDGTHYHYGARGLTVNNLARVERISVDYFPDWGFYFYGSVSGSPATNANNADVRLITSTNNWGGVCARGSDANVIIFDHINVGTNYTWGAVDSSFLGCTWIQPHAEDNGINNVLTRVRTGGQSYFVKRIPPIGMKPGVTAGWNAYFYPLTVADTTTGGWPYTYFTVWDTTTQYYSSGAYAATDNNARSLWIEPYMEGNQSGVLFQGTSTLVIHGLIAGHDLTANDDGGTSYQYIRAAGATRPGIDVQNWIVTSNNGYVTNIDKRLGGLEIRSNQSASFGFGIANVDTANKEIIFGDLSGTANIGLAFSGINYTKTWGRSSPLHEYNPIFYNGFYVVPASNGSVVQRFRSMSDLFYAGTNGYGGDVIFNTSTSGLPGLLGWQNISAGAGNTYDSMYVNGFIPRYTTANRPTTTFAGRMIFNVDSNRVQIYYPVIGWRNSPIASDVVSGSFVNLSPTSKQTGSAWLDSTKSDVASKVGTAYSVVTTKGSIAGSTSYSNSGGTGNRTSLITMTTDASTSGSFTTAMIDGVNNAGLAFWADASIVGKSVMFDFGAGNKKVIDTVKYYQGGSNAQGTWKWQGSNDNSTWTDIGSSFALGGTTTQTITAMSGNTTGYRYYRIFGISGSTTSGPYVYEFEFKIADAGSTPSIQTVGGIDLNVQKDSGYIHTNTPAYGDSSDKVATTAWVTHKMDSITAGGTITSPIQILNSQFTDAGNTSTTETDLLTYTMPAGQLQSDGDYITIDEMVTTASNGNSKSIKFSFGANDFIYDNTNIASGATISIKTTIVRTSATSVRVTQVFSTGFVVRPIYSSSTQTLSSSVVIKTAATGGATNDLIQRTMQVVYYHYTP